ncbi:MAG: AraC family transcriptional regulator [Porcipelethomonas sp.]
MPRVIYPVIGNQTALPFYLTGIGINDPEYHVLREKGLVSHQFLVTLDGEGILKVNGKTYTQKSGNCFYLSPSVPHEYYPADTQWKTAWLVFRGNMLSSVMQSLGFPAFLLYESPDTETFLNIFQEIYTAAQDSLNGSDVCSVLIYRLILLMSKNFSENQNPKTFKVEALQNAIRFMDDNFAQDITLAQIADISGVSVQHFCRCFRKRMGMRPMEYLAGRRIAESKNLLLNTDKSISDIAEEVGYHGATYFGMVFRKYEGITPGEFRKSKGSLTL